MEKRCSKRQCAKGGNTMTTKFLNEESYRFTNKNTSNRKIAGMENLTIQVGFLGLMAMLLMGLIMVLLIVLS